MAKVELFEIATATPVTADRFGFGSVSADAWRGVTFANLLAAMEAASTELRLRPTNVTNFTSLTNQEPNTLATSAGLTLTGTTYSVHPAVADGGVNTEVSGDGGITWGQSANVPVSVTGALKVRCSAPAYGNTDATPGAIVNGRRYSLSVTSREWVSTDTTAYLANLRRTSSFYTDIAGTIAGTITNDPVGKWVNTDGSSPVPGVALDNANRLVLVVDGGSKYLKGNGAAADFALSGGGTHNAYTCFARVRYTGVAAFGAAWLGLGFDVNARFCSLGATNEVSFYNPVTTILHNFAAPAVNTWFVIGVRQDDTTGIIEASVDGSAWTAIFDNSSFSELFTPTISPSGGPMVANQQISDLAWFPFKMSATSQANFLATW